MVLVVFTDVHTLTVKYKYALHMCVVCSWRTYVNLLWGETRRWKSTCYAAVSEVMRPSQNAKIHQCIERFALGWLKVLPYLWPLDCPCMHHFSLTLSCFLSFSLLSCDIVALSTTFFALAEYKSSLPLLSTFLPHAHFTCCRLHHS